MKIRIAKKIANNWYRRNYKFSTIAEASRIVYRKKLNLKILARVFLRISENAKTMRLAFNELAEACMKFMKKECNNGDE